MTNYKIKGTETWALVEEAYLRGEPARLVCERFGVGVSNMKRRAAKEGWTRRDHARATDLRPVRHVAPPLPASYPATQPSPVETPPPEAADPEAAIRAALLQAAAALQRGDAAQAVNLLKAAEALKRFSGEGGRSDPPPGPNAIQSEPQAAAEQPQDPDTVEIRARKQAILDEIADRLGHPRMLAYWRGPPIDATPEQRDAFWANGGRWIPDGWQPSNMNSYRFRLRRDRGEL